MARVLRGTPMRGFGDVCSDGPGAPWSWQRLKFTAAMCNDPYTVQGPIPAPPAPAVSLTSDAATPGAVYAGQDANGAAVYAVPQTAAENMATAKAALDQYFAKVGDVNPPADCTPWYSFLNPACGGGGSIVPWAVAGVVGLLLVGSMLGGRR